MDNPLGWREIKTEIARRINSREWPPGFLMPAETSLAVEFGCARATVNRAVRELADAGLVVRKRRAGTRVVENPIRKAQFRIPVIRSEVEQQGKLYTHRLLQRTVARPPAGVRALFRLSERGTALQLAALHLADDVPYAFESRWINLVTTPEARNVDFSLVSANEWLVKHAPYSGGSYTISAQAADDAAVDALNCKVGDPLVVVDRNTYDTDLCGITQVQLRYAVGHQLLGKM